MGLEPHPLVTTWLSERESLAKLGIAEECCRSCVGEEADGYPPGLEAAWREFAIETCCTHHDVLQHALEDGKLP